MQSVIKYLVLILLLSNRLGAQDNNIKFRHITSSRGLSHNMVYSILQDRKGFIWVGTYEGLNKYDGYQFTAYPNLTSGAASPGPISSILEDTAGYIWVGTLRGEIYRFDPNNEIFTKCVDTFGGSYNIPVVNILADSKGNIWSYLGNRVCKIITDKVKGIYAKPVWAINTGSGINSLYLDSGDNLWVGAHGKIRRLNIHSKNDEIKVTFAKDSLGSEIDQMYIENMTLWISGLSGIIQLNIKTNEIKHFFWREDSKQLIYFSCIEKGPIGNLWFGTLNNGLYRWNRKTNDFFHFEHDPFTPSSISTDQVNVIRKLTSGDIWIGTSLGLNIISHTGQFFKNYIFTNNFKTPRPMGVTSICKDGQGVTWVGTMGGGLHALNSKDGNKDQSFYFDSLKTYSYPYNYIYSLYPEGKDKLWIGEAKGLHLFDCKNKKLIKSYKTSSKFLKQFTIWAFLKDHYGQYWAGSRWSLFQFNPTSGIFSPYDYSPFHDSSIMNHAVWCIHEDIKYNLWLGTDQGLTKIERNSDGSTKKIIYYAPNTSPQKGKLNARNIFYIHETKNGLIWLASAEGGLIKFNPISESFTSFTAKDGLPSNSISGILEDSYGKFWISTINGICHFDPSSGRSLEVYDENDGLQSNHFNYKSCFKDEKGYMYFGGTAGMNVFDPSVVHPSKFQPPLVITSFKILYKEYKGKLNNKIIIQIPYSDNSFSFEFALLDFTAPAKNKFHYFLQGFDKTWINADSRHFVNYTNIPPGDYVFRLTGANSEGNFSANEIKIHIYIPQPYFLTWWYRIGMILILFGGLFMIAYFIIKQSREKRKRLQSELTALRSQLNPHFVFNSLTSLQSYIIENKQKLALDYLGKFSVLMRMILENSKKDYITIEQEKKFLELYLYMEAARFVGRFEFKISIDNNLDPNIVQIPSMILQPLVENSIKHGLLPSKAEGKLEISFIKDHNFVICSVIDNGVGRKKAMESTENSIIKHISISSSIIRERLEVLKQEKKQNVLFEYYDIYNNEGEVCGTKAIIKVPLIIGANNT